jgi:hypothetical protein
LWLLLATLCGQTLAGDDGHSSGARQEAQPPERGVATVEVSSVTVEPTAVAVSEESRLETATTVTVEMAHSPLTIEETVRLKVGTYYTDPASTDPARRVVVTYEPPSQNRTIGASTYGRGYGQGEIPKVEIGDNRKATVVMFASLTNPTPGPKGCQLRCSFAHS